MSDPSGASLDLLAPTHPEVLTLAMGLSVAVERDEAPEEGGFDLSAGLYGTHVSVWLRRLATDSRNARLRQERLLRAAQAALRYLHTHDQAADVVRETLERAITAYSREAKRGEQFATRELSC